MRTDYSHSQPTRGAPANLEGQTIVAKGIAAKSQASSYRQKPGARSGSGRGAARCRTPHGSNCRRIGIEARRQNEAAREQVDRLTRA